jgi:hypothetical protein
MGGGLFGLVLVAWALSGCSAVFSTDSYRNAAGDGGTDAERPGDGSMTDGRRGDAEVDSDGGTGDGSVGPIGCEPQADAVECGMANPEPCPDGQRCEPTFGVCVPCDCDGDGLVGPGPRCPRGEVVDCEDLDPDIGEPEPIMCGDGRRQGCRPPNLPRDAYEELLGSLAVRDFGPAANGGVTFVNGVEVAELSIAIAVVNDEPIVTVMVSDRDIGPRLVQLPLDLSMVARLGSVLSDVASGELGVSPRYGEVRRGPDGAPGVFVAGIHTEAVRGAAAYMRLGAEGNVEHSLVFDLAGIPNSDLAILGGQTPDGTDVPMSFVMSVQAGGELQYEAVSEGTQLTLPIDAASGDRRLDGSAGQLMVAGGETSPDGAPSVRFWDGLGDSSRLRSSLHTTRPAITYATENQFLSAWGGDSEIRILTAACASPFERCHAPELSEESRLPAPGIKALDVSGMPPSSRVALAAVEQPPGAPNEQLTLRFVDISLRDLATPPLVVPREPGNTILRVASDALRLGPASERQLLYVVGTLETTSQGGAIVALSTFRGCETL